MSDFRTFRVLFVGAIPLVFPSYTVSGTDDESLLTIRSDDGPGFRFELTRDGKTMATGRFSANYNNVARIWDTEKWQVTRTVIHPGKFLTISPDGRSVAIVSHEDAHLWLYDTEI